MCSAQVVMCLIQTYDKHIEDRIHGKMNMDEIKSYRWRFCADKSEISAEGVWEGRSLILSWELP